MQTNPEETKEPVNHDEDVKFEREKESTLVPLTETNQPGSPTAGEPILPNKEDTLATGEVKPLSEEEKLPKLPDESGS